MAPRHAKAYDPPANMPDFDGIPGQREQWSRAVSRWFDEAIGHQDQPLGGDPCQYYNQLENEPKGPLVEQEIVWNAFPGTLRRRFGLRAALVMADQPLPLTQRMDRPGPFLRGGQWANLFYRTQDEYCEWRVSRDDDGRITRVTFTSEPPEYWQALHGDEIQADDPAAEPSRFTGDRKLLLDLYRQYVDERVVHDDLICPVDLREDGNEQPTYRKGEYNPYNRWNTTDGIMHLTHPSNTLRAEIHLGADATVLRGSEGRLAADADVLIARGGYGGINRCSDPTIGASVNHLAARGFAVTLANPVGLYMDHLDMTGWADKDGTPIGPEWFQVERGSPRLIERAVFRPPVGDRRMVSDIRIGGVPIRHGGQLAERMTVKLVGLAAVGADFENRPSGFPERACAEAGNPWMVSSRPADDVCRPGSVPVFDYPEAISASRLVAPSPKPAAKAPASRIRTRAS